MQNFLSEFESVDLHLDHSSLSLYDMNWAAYISLTKTHLIPPRLVVFCFHV
jgi:hypothetical protein